MRCSSCGTINDDGAVFCGSCGAAVGRQDQDQTIAFPKHSVDGFDRGQRVTSDATRYLCAAVQLDSVLAERVIREIVDEEYKAPPLSPDVDLVQVLSHALAARGRQLLRDVALTMVLIVLLVLIATRVGLLLTAIIGVLFAWLIITVEQIITTYGIVARDLGPGRATPAAPPPSGSWAAHRLNEIGRSSGGNVTVYGSYSPFVGSGRPIEAWSFALDIERAAEGHVVEAFAVQDIHDYVLARMSRLGLAGVAVDERVFVDGRDLRGDGRFLPNELSPPVSRVGKALVDALTAAPEDRARTYMCLRVTGWRGQLVLSTFLRFVVTGNNLFVEVSHSLLTPILERYQEVDRLLPQPTFRQFIRIARHSFRLVLRGLFGAPLAVGRAALAPISRSRRRARQRREITTALRFNYGSTISPREVASDPRVQRYFQELDKSLYSKIVEKRLLEAIVTFLDDRGIDTGDLVARQTTILNQGVYVGGRATINAQSVAGGLGARAIARFTKTRTTAAQGAE